MEWNQYKRWSHLIDEMENRYVYYPQLVFTFCPPPGWSPKRTRNAVKASIDGMRGAAKAHMWVHLGIDTGRTYGMDLSALSEDPAHAHGVVCSDRPIGHLRKLLEKRLMHHVQQDGKSAMSLKRAPSEVSLPEYWAGQVDVELYVYGHGFTAYALVKHTPEPIYPICPTRHRACRGAGGCKFRRRPLMAVKEKYRSQVRFWR
tara:strand:+ start:513 stop:1118 length:606 start_codon:yes stop_codon:yes gene_type:complete